MDIPFTSDEIMSLQDLIIENVVADNTQRGFFFSKINRVSLRHVTHNGSGMGLRVNNLEVLCLDQILMGQNASVDLSNMQEVFAVNNPVTNYPLPNTAYFVHS